MSSSCTTTSSATSSPVSNTFFPSPCSNCSICFENFHNNSDGLKCTSGSHFICSEDFNKYCSEIAFSKIFLLRSSYCKIICPVPNCGENFESLESFMLLNNNEKKRFTNLLRETVLSTSNDLSTILLNYSNVLKDSLTLSCPYCAIAIDPTPDACSAVMCLNCSSYYCNYCFQCFNSYSDSSKNRAEAHEHVATHQPESNSSESRDAFLSPDLVKTGQRTYQKSKLSFHIKSFLISHDLVYWACNISKCSSNISSSHSSSNSNQSNSILPSTSNNIVNNLKHLVQLILILCYNDLLLLNLDISELWSSTLEQIGSINLEQYKNASIENKNFSSPKTINSQLTNQINYNPYNVVNPFQVNLNSQVMLLPKELLSNSNKLHNFYGQNIYFGNYTNFVSHQPSSFTKKNINYEKTQNSNFSASLNKLTQSNLNNYNNPNPSNLGSSINETNYLRKIMLLKKRKFLMMIKSSKNNKSNTQGKQGNLKNYSKSIMKDDDDDDNDNEDNDNEEFEDDDEYNDDGNMILIEDEEEEEGDEDDDEIFDGRIPHTLLTNHSYSPIEDISSYQEQFTANSASSTEDIDGEEDSNNVMIDDKSLSHTNLNRNKAFQNYYISNLAKPISNSHIFEEGLIENYFHNNTNSLLNNNTGNLYLQSPLNYNNLANTNSIASNNINTSLLNNINFNQKSYNTTHFLNTVGSNEYTNNLYYSMLPSTTIGENSTSVTSQNTSANRSGALLANAILANNMTAVDQILGAFGNNLDYDYVARSENHDLDIRVIFYPLTSLAILLGLESLAVQLIKLGANVLAVDSFKNRSVFYIAIEHGCTQVLQCIFEKYPNIDLNQPLTQEEVAYSALHIAARFNQGHLIEILMRYGARHNVFEKKDGYCPLGLAVALNNTWVALELIKFNAEVNWISDITVSPFYVAIEKGQLNVVQFILEKYPNLVNASIDTLGTKPIHLAVKFKHAHIVKYLIETCKSNCDLLDSDGLSPIMVAVQYNDIHSALLLLDYKVDLRNCTVDHRYCIHLVVERGHELLLNKIFMLYPEHVNLPCGADEEGHLCPIHVAIQFNQLTCLAILLKYNANINKKETQHGLTPIMLAAVCDNIAAIQILLSFKPDLNLSNAYGRKLLFILAERGLTDILPQIVSEYKIDVNQYLNEGTMNNTPLHVACMFNQPHMVHMLLELGANTSLLDAQGKTPLHLAEELNSLSAKHVLLKSSIKTPSNITSPDLSLEDKDTKLNKAIILNEFKYHIAEISSSNMIEDPMTSITTSSQSNTPIIKKKE